MSHDDTYLAWLEGVMHERSARHERYRHALTDIVVTVTADPPIVYTSQYGILYRWLHTFGLPWWLECLIMVLLTMLVAGTDERAWR